MSSEQNASVSNHESEIPRQADAGPLTAAQVQRERRARIVWWFKLVMQPLIAVGAVVLVVFAFGLAQRYGVFTSNEQVASTSAVPGEEVLYICPMVCVEPTTEPGKCPVCGMDLKAQKPSGDSKDKYGLTLDQASIRVANIRTVTAKTMPLVKQLRAIGEISYDEGSQATIAAYVDGRIEKLFADYTGVQVAEGDELALLYSPDLYSSQVALLESIKLINASQPANQRIRGANHRLYESSRQRLIELGLTVTQVDQLEKQGEADSRIRIVSPIAGTVIEKLAVNGQYVKTGQPIYKVANLSSVWLMMELFPKDASNVCFGQKVVTKIQSLPGREFEGRVAFIDPVVNSKTQTVRVRVVIPNKKGLIRVGDFATASITVGVNSPADQPGAVYDPDLVGMWISPRHPHVISDQPGKCTECGMDLVPASTLGFAAAPIARQHHVVVPRDSVLMAGDESVAYVETDPGRFEFRQVEVGQIVGDKVSIVKGIAAGDKVVASATLLVDSQFSMAGKPSLIDPNKAQPKVESEIDLFNSEELMAALSDLSEADRHAVVKQKICPVTEMALGSMGTPLPVDVDGKQIWICCKGCQGRLLEDPEKHLAVLENASDADRKQEKEIAEAMSGLSVEDQKLAKAQVFCPVGDMPLGSMGTPIKVDVNGQPVFICCEGCRKSLLDEPQKYLDILARGPSEKKETDPSALPAIKPWNTDQPPLELPQMALPQMAPPTESENTGENTQSKEIAKALSSLPVEDQALARTQKTCPVANMPLGSMGPPIKVDVNGQPVFICCEGCRKSLLDEPQKYLDILSKGPVRKPAAKTAELPKIKPLAEPLPKMDLPKMDLPKMDLPR